MARAQARRYLQTVQMQLDVLRDPTPGDIREVVERLVAWNLTVAPPEEHKKLVVLARDGGELVGGVAGYTHWNWLFVSHLWVADGQRGDGLGTRLMRAAESAAVDRGARHAHVDTYDFQALAFYEHLG